MKLGNAWKLALTALRRNKLQTALTMTGMTIGVATVLTMIALGSGAQSAIQDQVRAAGMNLILVSAGNYQSKLDLGTADSVEGPSAAAYHPSPRTRARFRSAVWEYGGPVRLDRTQSVSGDSTVETQSSGTGPTRLVPRAGDIAAGRGAATTLTVDDATSIRRIKGVQYVSAETHGNVNVSSGDQRVFTTLHGNDTTQPLIRRAWVFPYGRYFNKREEQKAENVVVLGEVVSEQLFGKGQNPVGRSLTMKNESFRIVGVVDSGTWMVRPAQGDDQFDAVYVPVTTMNRMEGRSYIDRIMVTADSTGEVTRVSKAVTALLRERHHIDAQTPDDFTIRSEARKAIANGGMRPEVAHAMVGNVSGFEKVTLDQLGKTLDRASATMSALLTSIAAVSLLVGGIGIMNIMLLSVSRRTREIGIRRAIGAQANDVLRQFLLEALTLSLCGGMAGITLGCIAASSLSGIVQWSTRISLSAISVSFVVSAAIGIFFGYYPARQASLVLPIEALRYE